MSMTYIYFNISFEKDGSLYHYYFKPTDYTPNGELKTEILRDVCSYLQKFSDYVPDESIFSTPQTEEVLSPFFLNFNLNVGGGLCTAFEAFEEEGERPRFVQYDIEELRKRYEEERKALMQEFIADHANDHLDEYSSYYYEDDDDKEVHEIDPNFKALHYKAFQEYSEYDYDDEDDE